MDFQGIPKINHLKNNLFLGVLGLHCCTGFLCGCSARESHRGGFSPCGARAAGTWASVAVAPGLWTTGSIVAAHGLSCSTACGIFLGLGWNLCLLHGQADSLPLSPQGSPRTSQRKVSRSVAKS